MMAGFPCEDVRARAPEFSDDALALAFSAAHDGRLLYVPAWSQWLRWDGARSAGDTTLAVFDRVRAVCRGVAGGADKANTAKAIASGSTVAAVERLARSDPRHARAPDAFDADPWALNTPGGVVDLRNGRLRPHVPGEMVTKVTAVAPSGACPAWRAFLMQACQGDADMVDYLQRFVGYSLTGDTSEHAFAFLYGPGGNGKSVLLNTVAAMLGDYATTAMADVFTGKGEHHATHMAALRGARFVLAGETEEGAPWREARLKSMTGGDPISARVMHGNPFSFVPQFKLWVAGNHRPVLRNPDAAMRRRMHLLPLTYVPPVPDPALPDTLRAELPGDRGQ